MYDTKSDLPERTRNKVAKLLNERLADAIDLGTALRGTAHGTLAAVSRTSSLGKYPKDITKGVQHLEALSAVLGDYGSKIRKAIDQSGKLGDADTADLFTGVSREVDKHLWFLEAHLQAKG